MTHGMAEREWGRKAGVTGSRIKYNRREKEYRIELKRERERWKGSR